MQHSLQYGEGGGEICYLTMAAALDTESDIHAVLLSDDLDSVSCTNIGDTVYDYWMAKGKSREWLDGVVAGWDGKTPDDLNTQSLLGYYHGKQARDRLLPSTK